MIATIRISAMTAFFLTALLAVPGQLPTAVEASTARTAAPDPAGHGSVGLTGTWAITIESPQGNFESRLELVHNEDDSLTGMTSNDMLGESPIDGGWVEEDRFGFSQYVDMQGQALDILYEGSFTEDEMAGFIEVGSGEFSAPFTGVRVEGGVR